jgi:hypothetical protein
MGIVAVRQPDGSIVYDYDSEQEGIQGRRQDDYASREEFLAKDPYMVERNRRAGEATNWQQYGSDQQALQDFSQFLNQDPWWQGRLNNYYEDRERGQDRLFRSFGTASDEIFNQRAGVLNRYTALRKGGWSHDDIINSAYSGNSPAYTPRFNNKYIAPPQQQKPPSGQPHFDVDKGPTDLDKYIAVCRQQGVPPDPAVVNSLGGGSAPSSGMPSFEVSTHNRGEPPRAYSLFSPENQQMRDFISQRLQSSLFGKGMFG